MPFPTVKSDPWKKGKRHSRRRFLLWSERFWKDLCKTGAPRWVGCKGDRLELMERQPFRLDLTPMCVEMITEMNLLLYGHA